MKTLLGIATKWPNQTTIDYLRAREGTLFVSYSSETVSREVPKDKPISAEQWCIFPSELMLLLAENDVKHDVRPACDLKFLEVAAMDAVYVAGERALKKLGLSGPAISWQIMVKDLPDSRLKNLVWLASEKWLEFMSAKPISFEAVD